MIIKNSTLFHLKIGKDLLLLFPKYAVVRKK